MNATHEYAVRWMLGQEANTSGFFIMDKIWANNEIWNTSHDMIQWAFPLEVPSNFNPEAPLVDRYKLAAEPELERLQFQQRALLYYYLRSIGILFDIPNGMVFSVTDRNELLQALYGGSHQCLRITRVITSLRLFKQDEIVNRFALLMLYLATEYPRWINNTAVDYWYNAATEPL